MSRVSDKKARYVQRTYGMTLEQYQTLVTLRRGCWVCLKTKRKDGRPLTLFIEHDHKSGRVRGVACMRCNRFILGQHHDGALLRRAADYLDSTFDGRAI